jgi:hypothetical protein
MHSVTVVEVSKKLRAATCPDAQTSKFFRDADPKHVVVCCQESPPWSMLSQLSH